MAHPGTHRKAFKGKYHKNQEAQADGPEVVGWELRKGMCKKLVGNIGGIQRDECCRQGHHRKQACIKGRTCIVVGYLPFSRHESDVDNLKTQQ